MIDGTPFSDFGARAEVSVLYSQTNSRVASADGSLGTGSESPARQTFNHEGTEAQSEDTYGGQNEEREARPFVGSENRQVIPVSDLRNSDSVPSCLRGNPSDADYREAEARAELCREFLRLTTEEKYSANMAASQLGKSASLFSGAGSMLALFKAGGVQALLPKRRDCGRKAEILVPDWFVPAAKYFYLLTNRTRSSGSVPEAIRRTISLPNCPPSARPGLLKVLSSLSPRATGRESERGAIQELPICPTELRELCLAREKAGKPFLPERITRQISCSAATVHQYRNPKNAALDYLNSPGSTMWVNGENGERTFVRAGDIIEADDATINFPVCVPWTIGGDPCSEKFGVKVGRFQWLVSIDVASRFITGYSYTVRPKSSYRGEDVLSLFRAVTRQHGVPRQWRLEQGVWKSNLVQNAIKMMGSKVHTVHSPHQKPFIEGLFNALWTKLAVHFPKAQVGRFRGEGEEATKLLTACQRGHQDPRKYFPMLADVLAAFAEVIAEKNQSPVQSGTYGTWIPEERWLAQLAEKPLRQLDGETDWIFSPFVREWTVRGMLVGGRVPIFEDLSVPFDFSADWLPQFNGAKVRCYFDPSEPRCAATIVLAENFGTHQQNEVLGSAVQINEVAGYARLVMGWGDDPASAGRVARQQAAKAMRREVRGVIPRGSNATPHSASEERDGIATVTKIESSDESRETKAEPSCPRPSTLDSGPVEDLTAKRTAIDDFEKENAHLFV